MLSHNSRRCHLMKNKLVYLEEPLLVFGHNQCTEDCHDGLTLFGPFEKADGSLSVGVIGTKHGIGLYSVFVAKMNKPLLTNSLGRPSFPGFSAVFGMKWPEIPQEAITLDSDTIEELAATSNLHERTYKLVSLYIDKIVDYMRNSEKVIDIWYVVVPHALFLNCRPNSKTSRPTYSKKRVESFLFGQTSLFDHEEQDLPKYVDMYESDTDFHDQFKARILAEKVHTPVQIIHERTLQFKDKIVRGLDIEYADEMKAHLLWTQASSTYYKLGHLPWKLANARDGVCYIGLVFKKIQSYFSNKGYVCSAAQMFLDSGDGMVFRGNIGPWQSKNQKTYHLDKAAAKELLAIAINSYREQTGHYPKELFIHGKAAFTDEEWDGFLEAIEAASDVLLVGVTIKLSDGLKIFNDTFRKEGNYGVMRGLAYKVDERNGYLWTKGFIPSIETANHMEVASPLRISITRGDADIVTVMNDILSLTKLNYNACIYGDGMPVTLRFSDLIGNILTAIKDVNWPAKPFKYYI